MFHIITQKTSEQTDKRHIDIATKRYKEIVEHYKKLEQETKTEEPTRGENNEQERISRPEI